MTVPWCKSKNHFFAHTKNLKAPHLIKIALKKSWVIVVNQCKLIFFNRLWTPFLTKYAECDISKHEPKKYERFIFFFTLIMGRWGRRLTELTLSVFELQKAMIFQKEGKLKMKGVWNYFMTGYSELGETFWRCHIK